MKFNKKIVLIATFILLVVCITYFMIDSGKTVPVKKLLQDDFAELLINQQVGSSINGGYTITDEKLTNFQKLLQNVSLKEIGPKDFQKLEIARFKSENPTITSILLDDNQNMNGFTIISLPDGNLLVVKMVDNLGKQFYRITDKSPKLYQDIMEYYVKNSPPLKEGVLDSLN